VATSHGGNMLGRCRTVGEETGVTKLPRKSVRARHGRDTERTWRNVMGDGISVLFLLAGKEMYHESDLQIHSSRSSLLTAAYSPPPNWKPSNAVDMLGPSEKETIKSCGG